MTGITTMAEGRFLRLLKKGQWEYVERTNARAVVGIVALTADGNMILVEQHRPPLGAPAIELPAGLVGDVAGQQDEDLLAAAHRELLEETGYSAGRMTIVAAGPTSAGLTSETVTLVLAQDLVRQHAGGGDDTESITVHAVPIGHMPEWLTRMQHNGVAIDLKIYAGLYFAAQVAE